MSEEFIIAGLNLWLVIVICLGMQKLVEIVFQ